MGLGSSADGCCVLQHWLTLLQVAALDQDKLRPESMQILRGSLHVLNAF